MKVLVLVTWENPKSDEDLKKYYEYQNKHRQYWIERSARARNERNPENTRKPPPRTPQAKQ